MRYLFVGDDGEKLCTDAFAVNDNEGNLQSISVTHLFKQFLVLIIRI